MGTMSEIGKPLSGDIYFEVESSYGNGFSGSQSRFSDAVENVRIDTGEISTELWSISEPSLIDFQKTMEDPTLHVEYVYQPHTGVSAVSYFYNRTNCDLDSLAIEVGVNLCGSAPSYFYLKGCKAKNFTISGRKGETYKVSVDFSVSEISVSNSATGTAPGSLGNDYAAFNNAGGITWAGVTGAYVTEGFEVTVNNNITDYYDVGSTDKSQATPGRREITGNCDISLDGGGTNFSEVLAATDITQLDFNTGCTDGNLGTIELHNGRFDSTNIELNTDSAGIMSTVPFTFKKLAFTTGT